MFENKKVIIKGAFDDLQFTLQDSVNRHLLSGGEISIRMNKNGHICVVECLPTK